MNFCSEQRASYYVRSSLAFHLSCIAFVCYVCLVFIVSPPLLLSGSLDDRCRCPCDRLRRRRSYPPYCRASRQADPLPLSHISPTFLYLSVALGICCCYVTILFNCIAYLCRPLISFRYPMLPYIKIIFRSGPCALLVDRFS